MAELRDCMVQCGMQDLNNTGCFLYMEQQSKRVYNKLDWANGQRGLDS